jgi:hypothetical protein
MVDKRKAKKKVSRKKSTQKKKSARKQAARPAKRGASASAKKRKSGSDEDIVYTDVRRAMHSAIMRRLG